MTRSEAAIKGNKTRWKNIEAFHHQQVVDALAMPAMQWKCEVSRKAMEIDRRREQHLIAEAELQRDLMRARLTKGIA